MPPLLSPHLRPKSTTVLQVLAGLDSGRRFEVAVRDESTGVVSEPLLMRTAKPGVLYTAAYRISEYTDQVSQHGQLLGRRGCVSPANASGFDTHRDTITCQSQRLPRGATGGLPAKPRRGDQGQHATVPTPPELSSGLGGLVWRHGAR
jgi:hypothetical protein